MADERAGRGERAGDEAPDDERPRLRDLDHVAPDGVSADGVFDRGTAERDERRASGETGSGVTEE